MRRSLMPVVALSAVVAGAAISLAAQSGVSTKQAELIAAQERAITALKGQVEAQKKELAASADLTNAHRGLIAEYRKAVAIRDEALARR